MAGEMNQFTIRQKKSSSKNRRAFEVIPLGFEPRAHTLKVYCSTS